MELKSEEKLKVCSVCEFKTDDWNCDVSKGNIFSMTKDDAVDCPKNKWDKGFFPASKEAELELQQLSLKSKSVFDELGTLKIENISREAFSAQFKKQNLILKPNKNLISPATSVEDVLYCIKNFPPGGWKSYVHQWDNVQKAYRQLANENGTRILTEKYPEDRFSGKGIVMCGGGPKYYPSMYVNLRILRLLGCKLPVKVYYIGEKEMDTRMIAILESIEDVECIDGTTLEKKYPIRIHSGWESKVYAIINCPFEEVLMLDADNTPLVNPEFLFSDSKYEQYGSILWPDYECWRHDEKMWEILGIKYRKELQVESGQVLVNKKKCWKEINMAKYYCDYSDYYFKLFYGDKETFHFGWRFFDSDYGFPPGPDWFDNRIIVQKDITGGWLFSHRAQAKFKLDKSHPISMNMPWEQDTLDLLDELASLWDGHIWINDAPNQIEKQIIEEVGNKKYNYTRVGLDSRIIKLESNRKISDGGDKLERNWHIFFHGDVIKMAIHGDSGLTALLIWDYDRKLWGGQWVNHEKCKVELKVING